eukprot:UC4_evm7s969
MSFDLLSQLQEKAEASAQAGTLKPSSNFSPLNHLSTSTSDSVDGSNPIIRKKLGAPLRQQKIALWLPPFTLEGRDNIADPIAIVELAKALAALIEEPIPAVARELELIRIRSVKKIAAKAGAKTKLKALGAFAKLGVSRSEFNSVSSPTVDSEAQVQGPVNDDDANGSNLISVKKAKARQIPEELLPKSQAYGSRLNTTTTSIIDNKDGKKILSSPAAMMRQESIARQQSHEEELRARESEIEQERLRILKNKEEIRRAKQAEEKKKNHSLPFVRRELGQSLASSGGSNGEDRIEASRRAALARSEALKAQREQERRERQHIRARELEEKAAKEQADREAEARRIANAKQEEKIRQLRLEEERRQSELIRAAKEAKFGPVKQHRNFVAEAREQELARIRELEQEQIQRKAEQDEHARNIASIQENAKNVAMDSLKKALSNGVMTVVGRSSDSVSVDTVARLQHIRVETNFIDMDRLFEGAAMSSALIAETGQNFPPYIWCGTQFLGSSKELHRLEANGNLSRLLAEKAVQRTASVSSSHYQDYKGVLRSTGAAGLW